ncbi:MAG: hypothetical protein ACRC1F_01775 [Metamycoplasmataceae bacterium]
MLKRYNNDFVEEIALDFVSIGNVSNESQQKTIIHVLKEFVSKNMQGKEQEFREFWDNPFIAAGPIQMIANPGDGFVKSNHGSKLSIPFTIINDNMMIQRFIEFLLNKGISDLNFLAEEQQESLKVRLIDKWNKYLRNEEQTIKLSDESNLFKIQIL